MVSSKPKTGGLAALLRVEKERREREEAEQEAASLSSSGGDQPQEALSDPALSNDDDSATERQRDDSSLLKEAEPQYSRDTIEGDLSIERSTRPVFTEETVDAPEIDNSAPRDSSLPRPRPSAVRPLRPKRMARAPSADAGGELGPGWEKFVADWKPFLREGVKFKLCEFFYQNTSALGKREFATSSSQLARIVGSNRRHIFLVLGQLEELRFIRKRSVGTNKKDEGLIIHFSPDRQS